MAPAEYEGSYGVKSDEIFRFVNLRPPQRAPQERVDIHFGGYGEKKKSPLHQQVESLQEPGAREKATDLARQHLASDRELIDELEQLDMVKEASSAATVREAKERLAARLKQPLESYLASEGGRRLKDRIWDAVYAHTLAPEVRPEDREVVFQAARAFHFLELLVKQDERARPLSWDTLQQVTLTIPRGVVPDPTKPDDQRVKVLAEQARAELDAVHARVTALTRALDDLTNGDRSFRMQQLQQMPKTSGEALLEHAGKAPRTLPIGTIQPTGPVIPPGASSDVIAGNRGETPVLPVEHLVVVPRRTPWIFAEFGEKVLSGATRQLLTSRRADFEGLEVPEVIARLEKERYEVVSNYLTKLRPEALEYVKTEGKFAQILEEVPVANYTDQAAYASRAIDPTSAAGRGIKPLGIGDLLVVRQELLRYVAGEVAHIENVLQSEYKTRTHTRLRETEEIVITETEALEESEKDLQTTERFELQKESEKTIESQMNLEAGLAITAGYGPVSVTAHADFALSQSTTEATKSAANFARQVTERSVSRILQRAREERTRRTLERFEEKNEHGLDNKAGTGHVIGIYRWVDKYYKARVINYGRRLMMEFVIPEPAAFYRYLHSKRPLTGVTLEKPKEPMVSGRRLQPTDLNAANYATFVAEYNVQDVEPYPAEIVRVSAAFAETTGQPGTNVDYAKTSEKLVVPQGYRCRDIYADCVPMGVAPGGNPRWVIVTIGGERLFGDPYGKPTTDARCYGLEGVLPIAVVGWLIGFSINVVAVCELKEETKQAWQLKTYQAIMNAYGRALATYNEQVAAAQIQAGVQIEGRNPEINRKIEKEELKKGALRLLTNNYAATRVTGTWLYNATFDAMQPNGAYGYPDFNIGEALIEGKIIQFFEQAFEWENMTYRFYPYFWGRKGEWGNVFPLNDLDPQFTDFLRAGAARVVVPVRPAYTESVLHYLNTNEIWNGGSPPTLADPLYVSIVDEIKANTGADLDDALTACSLNAGYPCVVDEWEVKLPTTLVYLQQDATLPDFTGN